MPGIETLRFLHGFINQAEPNRFFIKTKRKTYCIIPVICHSVVVGECITDYKYN